MYKNNKGITLIALVITIIVMLILVAVTISMAVNGGLFNYAGKATGETKNAINAEQELANGGVKVGDVWYNSIDEYLATKNLGGGTGEQVETISKTESYVGYYADVDGNGTADGIIYADLAIGGSGSWVELSYSYDPVTGVKDYYISGTEKANFYEEAKEVLTATGDGKERFYVMAFKDIDGQRDGTTYTWYEAGWRNEQINVNTVSEDFGAGKANTDTMIAIWNADTDENKSSKDVWGQIQTQVNKGWFLPSILEWAAFTEEFGISVDNVVDYGLSYWYQSSSFNSNQSPWTADYTWGSAPGTDYGYIEGAMVRLSTTF